MSKTKNMHYLSQMISRNFTAKDGPRTFLQYDFSTATAEIRNIKNLFSRYKPWGQNLENVLSGDSYENKLAPLLKELVHWPIARQKILGSCGLVEAQFNSVVIENEKKKKLISKLLLQNFLLQRSSKRAEDDSDLILSHVFDTGIRFPSNLLLVEVHPQYICPPLILTDGMVFLFICPDKNKEALGHFGFMFPISERRFLLWVSNADDCGYFCAKYKDINYLNLCRIEQHDKKCIVALAKTEPNERYLLSLVRQVPFFSSHDAIAIRTTREWM